MREAHPTREESYGKLLAIANVLGKRVFEHSKPSIASIHTARLQHNPAKVFAQMHAELIQYAHKFDKDELVLLDMFGEILDDLGEEGFTNEPLGDEYLHPYYKMQKALFDRFVSAEQAAKVWGVSAGHVKNLCRDGKIAAKKIGKTWVIDINQPNPSKNKNEE
ncbi:helix-turn-helix domain-containing protein [Shouchella clausii]|uniref:helix-turn-helix domain-containing protein n=1 Tax=Shouchella clausii TaxID=79880 RepID=UPI00115511C5|nr:helix-turn-helix domain-containing protein [Shouchella clausii]